MGMRKFLLILLIFGTAQAQTPMHKLIRKQTPQGFVADSAQFSFSGNNPSVEPAETGWVVLQPDPRASILTASQNSYSISTVGTGNTYWNDNGLGAAAGRVSEDTQNPPFTANVATGYFFHASTTFPSGGNIQITGPSSDAYYDVYMLSVRPTVTDNRLTKFQCIGRYETRTRNNVNSAPSSNSSNDSTSQVTSGGTWVRFKNVRPNTSNYIFVNIAAETAFTFGYINAIKIVRRENL